MLEPLWTVLQFGAFPIVTGTFLLIWIGLVAVMLGSIQRRASRGRRVVAGLLGVVMVALAIPNGVTGEGYGFVFRLAFRLASQPIGGSALNPGTFIPATFIPAVLGVVAIGFGVGALDRAGAWPPDCGACRRAV